jgi:anti-sigma-K factor RskA
MRSAPHNPALLDRLAAEYVLGTLRGPARRRFERWRDSSNLVDQRCQFWEERLMPLLRGLEPAWPPPHVWQGIRQRLNLQTGPPRRRRMAAPAIAASIVLAIAAAALLYWRVQPFARVSEVATISAPSGTLLWRVEVYARAGAPDRIEARAGALTAPPAGHDYELWALPKAGSPVSLGVLPYQSHAIRRALTLFQQQALQKSTQLAVSIEPPRGSPTGAPTGAVVFVVPLRASS